MKKTLIVGILLTTLLLGGCTSQIKKEDPLTSENMKYSTMSDEDTQKKVSDFLSKNNIDKKDISMFMQSVQHYYKSVEGVELLNENERLSKMQVPYNLYDLSDKWIENNPNFTDQNCRITAFRLFNKFIISNSSFVNLPGLFKILSSMPILPISCRADANVILYWSDHVRS